MLSLQPAHAQSRAGSSRVPSPDGSLSVIVDRVQEQETEDSEEFSGNLLVRILDAEGSIRYQRRVEASQVRLMQPVVWLDDTVCAFSYNIAKNSNGIVYVDATDGTALQLEMVATSRRMAASGRVETELTSLEVAHYAGETKRLNNITRADRSVFPIIALIPPYTNEPYGKDFYSRLRDAVAAYDNFLQTRGISRLEIEQASESFSPSQTHLAFLACVDDGASAMIVPLKPDAASTVMKQVQVALLGPEILLGCRESAEEMPDETTTESMQTMDYRYSTAWKNDNLLLVEKETFLEDEENSVKSVVYSVSSNGKATKVTDADTTLTAPRESESSAPAARKATPRATAETESAASRETTRSRTAERPADVRRATPRATTRATVAPSPATPEPTREGLLRRMIPGRRGRSAETPIATPATR